MTFAELENVLTTCPRCGCECSEAAVAVNGQCDECTGEMYMAGEFDPFEGEDTELCECDDDKEHMPLGEEWDDERDERDYEFQDEAADDDYDDQPDEYTEWQDLHGGDDWDHGQYDVDNDW